MPLFNPKQIQEVLEESGVIPKTQPTPTEFVNLFEVNNLSDNELIEQLASIARGAGSDSVRLRAIEVALRAKGRLTPESDAVKVPNLTIVIQDPNSVEVNPILIPRQ